MDDSIISAATGTSKTGSSGAADTDMISGNIIGHGSADLTLAKLIQAKKILDEGSVDASIPRYIAVAPAQIEALLGTTQVQSADFNSIKSLVQGEVDTFMGFKFIMSTRLAVASNIRTCFAWAEDGLKLAVGKDVMAKIDERADKSYATQVFYCSTFGSTRMEEAKVVSVLCDESA
jgi:hypothetical protein